MRVFKLLFVLCFVMFDRANSARATWNKIAQFNGMGRISVCYFFSADTGLIAFHGPSSSFQMLHTTDGGISWKPVNHPPVTPGLTIWFSDIWFRNRLEGWATFLYYATNNQGGLWHTTDGGLTWSATALHIFATSVRETNEALIVTGLSGFTISTDNGQSFKSSVDVNKDCTAFTDDLHGAATGYFPSTGTFSFTSDGGLTWHTSMGFNNETWGLYALKGGSSFVASPEHPSYGEKPSPVYRSDDYGQTWRLVTTLPIQSMGDIVGEDSMVIVQSYQYGPSGLYRSTDLGSNWRAIGGPNQFVDARLSLVPKTCGSVLYASDSSGGLWKTTDGGDGTLNGNPSATLHLSNVQQVFTQQSCSSAVDTAVYLSILGCGNPNGLMDSAWLDGSSAISISDSRSFPHALGSSDSISLRYVTTGNEADTAHLHLRYELNGTSHDTTITIIGQISSPLLGSSEQLHREAAAAYYGGLDTLPLAIDMSPSLNLDSLWPFLTEIQATYAFDSSVVSFANYFPPSGWSMTSIANRGNAVDIDIRKVFATVAQPLLLGTALFSPVGSSLASAWVFLPRFNVVVDGTILSLCATDNEDSHWSVKTLGSASSVALPQNAPMEFTLSPNPAQGEVTIGLPEDGASNVEIYDVLGNLILQRTAEGSFTWNGAQNGSPDANGAYIVRVSQGNQVSSKRLIFVR